jgi:two-component system sensor histidine kinase KdpD
LSTLIDNLLDMSRIQTGAIEPFLRPVALDEVLPAILRAVERGGELLLDVPDDLPLLHTDPVLLERVVVNLASNALRYSPPDAPPTLVGRVAPDGRTVEIAVVDHGPGIPQPDRERVFQPFQQLGDGRSGGGVGLGLAVARGFVEVVGGRIRAAATPGGGLTMRFTVPAVSREHTGSEVLQ